jgi:hypothetical protein
MGGEISWRRFSWSFPSFITWAAITYFAINQSPLVKLFDRMQLKLRGLLAFRIPWWHYLKAVYLSIAETHLSSSILGTHYPKWFSNLRQRW